jgi:hypothetical protein
VAYLFRGAFAGIDGYPIGSTQGASVLATLLAGKAIRAGMFFILLRLWTENFSGQTGIYLPCHNPTSECFIMIFIR